MQVLLLNQIVKFNEKENCRIELFEHEKLTFCKIKLI